MNVIRTLLIFLLTSVWINSSVMAQQIIFDKGVRIGQLSAFPDVSNQNEYYYLPDKIEVAKHPDGRPQFSFLRYVRNTDAEDAGSSSITESNEAGGVVHVVVSLSVPEDVRREAERELQRINGSAKLMGPVMYQSGKIALISSIIGEDGNLTKKVVGLGSAPILEGQKAAVSVLLTKEGSDILWATFQTPTPDLSFQMEMDAKGYQSPKRVTIEANFDQIYKHTAFEAAAVSPVFAAEIKTAFDDLSNSGAIKVTQIGEDADLNKMKETAYNQLVNLMFDKVGGQSLKDFASLMPNSNKSMLDRATDMLTKARKEARDENKRLEDQEEKRRREEREARNRARRSMDSIYRARGIQYDAVRGDAEGGDEQQSRRVPIPEFAVAASFQMKQIKRTGKYFIDLNKYTEDQRTFPFSENVGNMKQLCPTCFVSVNLDDPLYKQRKVQVRLSGVNDSDFGTYISSVEVMMRKEHQNKDVTLKNVIIDKNIFNKEANQFGMQYGWKGDDDRDEWLDYEYKTKWVFSGGFSVETDWKEEQFASIVLDPPLVKKDVYVELDPETVKENNIRAVEVKLFFENEGVENSRLVNIKASDNILSKSVELILPKNVDDYQYEVTWFIKGKPPVKKDRTDYNYGTLYLDTVGDN